LADIFISYARADRGRVEPLVAALQASGYTVWWDRQMIGGSEFAETIEEELNAAGVVIAAWSEAAVRSVWVKDEAVTARDAGKLITISLDGARPPLGFKQYHVIDFAADKDAAKADLIRSIAQKLELSPETPVAPSSHNQGRNVSDRAYGPKMLGLIGAVLLALVISGLLFLSKGSDDRSKVLTDSEENVAGGAQAVAAKDYSIAVLPFANRSANAEDAFFTAGVHDDLLTHLSRLPDLRVISRTSVMGYLGSDKKIPQIAQELGVANILEGGVQRAGNQIRITVQLIDARTDEHIWAENYDRELTTDNIFAIQTEIAGAIAAALNIAMSQSATQNIAERPTQNLAAYEAFMKGRLEKEKMTSSSSAAAIEYFKQAITLDPNYASAYANLADSYTLLVIFGGMLKKDGISYAEPLARKAIELSPELAEAWAVLAHISDWRGSEYREQAEAEYERAISYNENYAYAYDLFSVFKMKYGEYEDARALSERALALYPNSPSINETYAFALWAAGHVQEAKQRLEENAAKFPEFPSNYASLGAFYVNQLGRMDKALPALEKATEIDPGNPNYTMKIAYSYAALGDIEGLQALRAGLVAQNRDIVNVLAVESVIASVEGKFGEWVQLMRTIVGIRGPHDMLGVALAYEGAFDEALEVFEGNHAHWVESEPRINPQEFWYICTYAYVEKAAGDEMHARQVARNSLEVMRGYGRGGAYDFSFDDILCYVVLDEIDEGLAALREAADAGVRLRWNWLKYPPYAPLHDRPEFKETIATIEADIAAQRANLASSPDWAE